MKTPISLLSRCPIIPLDLQRRTASSGSPFRTQSLLRYLFLFSLLLLAFFFPSLLSAQFSFIGFRPGDSLCRVGDAQLVQGEIMRLAPNEQFMRGGIWHKRKQPVAAGFTTRFSFRLGEPGGKQQADGLALVIQNADSCALGSHAQGIGYDGIPNSLAIEFDTWYNEGADLNNNHISIHSRGQGANRADFTSAISTREAVPVLGLGVTRDIIVDYNGSELRIYMGECQNPLFTARVNLNTLLRLDSGRAWVGITASTGLNHQNHDLFNWEFQVKDETVSQKCLGDSAILEGPKGFPRYRWARGDTTRTITVRQSGEYRLYVSGSLICPDEETEYIFYASVAERTFAPRIFPQGPVILCRGDSVTLTALTGPYTDDRFLWSTGDTTRSITVNRSGKYALLLTGPDSCEYRLDTVQVLVRIPPQPTILPGDSIFLCTGDSVRLWVPDVFRTYLWSTGATRNEIVASKAGIYTLTVTDADGCEGYDTAVVAMPDGITLTSDTAICAGGSVQLTASGRTEYRWSPTDGLSCTDCPNPIASPTATTLYTVQGTNNGGCASEARVRVSLLAAQADAGADTLLCLGDTLRLRGAGDGGSDNQYLWEPTTDLSCADCSDPLAYPRQTTTYYLRVVNGNGCVARDSVTITVQSAGNVRASDDTAICSGGSVQLSVRGGDIYRWTQSNELSCTDCANPIATPAQTTTYYVIGTKAGEGCAAIDSVTVTVNALPLIDAGADTAICAGSGLRLGASGGEEYRWEPSPDLSCLDCPDPVVLPTQTTTYYVTGTSAEGCEVRDSIRVEVHPGLTVSAGEDQSICAEESAQLSAVGGVRWLWTPADGLSCVDCPDPVASPRSSTTYRVTAWNAEGCAGSDSVRVTVREQPEIVRLRIDRGYRGRTGEVLEIAIESVGIIDATDIDELEFVLRYDPNVLQIDRESLSRLLSGTILAGWNIELQGTEAGMLTARFTAPPGAVLRGNGAVIRFAGQLFLSAVRGTELSFTVGTKSRCFSFETAPGYAEVDSICGLNFRLIELTSEKYVPPTVSPNPAKERVKFEFGLGLDGPTRLEAFDALGNRVGLILDDILQPGRYVVEWDVREMPTGMYWYRLTSGDWSSGGEVRIVR